VHVENGLVSILFGDGAGNTNHYEFHVELLVDGADIECFYAYSKTMGEGDNHGS
jgi:hypothetical protein